MSLTRAKREELEALSKEVFGVSSRYKKLMDQGYDELVTEDMDDVVPGENGAPDTNRKVKVPVKRSDGALQYVHKYHTVESVEEYMLECKVRLDKVKAEIKRQQDEAKAKKEAEELSNKVHQELVGSAV